MAQPNNIDDYLAKEKGSIQIWSEKEKKYISYNNLSREEQMKFDDKYPNSGYTDEEYFGIRS
jgi:hypothetical protein